MSTIFVSYSSKNKDFAETLVEDLEQYYDVWIDQSDLAGGIEWERSIDRALQDCAVFIVIVSKESNDSEWVARETIRAEQLDKPRIPILFSDELPLRLLNLQYVDFRGQYAGGFRDLLAAMKTFVEPKIARKVDAGQLLGEGILAHLNNNYPVSNSLIGQVLVLRPDIAPSVDAFWDKLCEWPRTNFAERWMKDIVIRERATIIKEDVYSKQADATVDWYAWEIQIDNDENLLQKIDYVQYRLHETFANPIQIVRSRGDKFTLRGRAWGTFPIEITIHFIDGTSDDGVYPLSFKNRRLHLIPND